jgi:hypothetical protein
MKVEKFVVGCFGVMMLAISGLFVAMAYYILKSL